MNGSIIFKETLSSYGLTLVEALPAYKVTSSLYPLLWYSTLLLPVYITAIGIFTTAVASIIAKPITRLKIMLENLDENYHRNVEGYKGKDEIAILSIEYNKLISRLDELIYENYQANLRESQLMFLEKEAQLNALQQQINPHFLYNTLESIKWMAYKKGDRKVCDMAAALGSFFRGAVSNKKELVTFGEELDHLENYIYIQKIRYNNKFSIQIDFEPSVKELLTVKLVLQPLVENSIIHGLEPMESTGAILIEGKNSGGTVGVTVKDNGSGMGPDELAVLRKRITGEIPEAAGSSIGLNNVYRRIQLYFSGRCSFEIDSSPGQGTTVTMEIPAIKNHS
jgi:two-component system sensor histidine kinase YesM